MDYSMLNPRTCVLRVYIHCQGCEKDIHKVLKKIKGVTSVLVDRENNEVRVSGAVDPYTLIRSLEKINKRAEVLFDSTNVVKNQNHTQEIEHGLESMRLDKLLRMDGVKQLEWTQVKTTKTTFSHGSGQKTETTTKNTVKIITSEDGLPSLRRGGGGGGFYGGGTSRNWISSGGGDSSCVGYVRGGVGGHTSLKRSECPCDRLDLPPPYGGWDSGRTAGDALPSAPSANPYYPSYDRHLM